MKKLFLLLALLVTTVAPAQTAKQRNATVFDLQQKYDLWPSDGKLLVQDVMKVADAKTKYPACFTAWEREKKAGGMTVAQADTWIMGMTLGEAAYFDALWTNADWSANSGQGRGLCLSRNTIIWPGGTYYTRDQLDYGHNIIQGTSNSSNDEPSGRGGTVIKLWNEQWRGDASNRILFAAYHAGTDGSNSYSESVQFSDLRLDGGAGAWKNAAYTITGLQAWDFGSGSEVHNVFISHCDIGIESVRGTPFTATGNNAIFECNTAAVALTGCAGATITFSGTLESDDCPTLFLVRGGWSRASGALLNVESVKVEWAITSARTWKPEAIVTGEGWMDMNFGSIHYATGNVHLDALFNLKGNVNTSYLHVGDLQVFAGSNVQALVHDDIAQQTWMYDVGWTSKIKTFDWYCDGKSSQLVSWPVQAISVAAPQQGRLGYLMGDPVTAKPVGSFDRTKGLPTWSDVTGTSKPQVRNLRYVNGAYAIQRYTYAGFQQSLSDIGAKGIRWPGGTVGNTYHPDATLAQMVSVSSTAHLPVIWMCNLNTGTTAEAIAAIKAFKDAGVPVDYVELGNECYLPDYSKLFPNVQGYLTKARLFYDAIRSAYPDLPCALVCMPSVAMKDAQTTAAQVGKITDWNTAVKSSTFGEGLVFHAYVAPTNVPGWDTDFIAACGQHVADLAATGRDVLCTEWSINLSGNTFGGTTTQTDFIAQMLAAQATWPGLKYGAYHCWVLAQANGYEAVFTDPQTKKCTLTPAGLKLQSIQP